MEIVSNLDSIPLLESKMFDLLVTYKISDLMFGVRIEEAGKKSSTKFKKVESLDDLASVMSYNVLIVCDLPSIKSELEQITKLAKEKKWKILGYYPHVDRATETLARSLGVDYVTPRSVMQQKLNTLLI